jgi:hypothetical protein
VMEAVYILHDSTLAQNEWKGRKAQLSTAQSNE